MKSGPRQSVLALLAVMMLFTPAVRADDLASEALRLCEDAERADPSVRDAMLARGVSLAEQAVAADDHDARAHFALFCTQARQVEAAGLSLGSMFTVRRLHRMVDRALALDPDYVDALVAKAGMLRRLPRLFGGDQAEANRCLTRALALDPSHPVGRRYAVADGLVVDETVVLAGQPGPLPEPTESQWQ
jgi:hypothetical protein